MPAQPARRGLLNSAATFLGIGQGLATPAATKPKGDDEEMTAAEKEEKRRADTREERRRARNKKAGRKEDDDGEDGPVDDDDDDEDDDDESPEARESRENAEDDDDMKKDCDRKAASLRERARCAAIFASPHAVGRLDTAARLAFTTSLPRHEAIAVLSSTPKGGGGTLGSRMEGHAGRNAGPAAPPVSRQAAIDAGWDAAAGKVAVTRK